MLCSLVFCKLLRTVWTAMSYKLHATETFQHTFGKKLNGFRSLELEDFNKCGMTIIEWCSSSADVTNNELIILPFGDCTIITIIFYIIQLTVSNQLYVLLFF